ncbi:MAG: prepilin-type N-terminal cleavage/methylation domain-containing protein [Zoogloeaceae bacterium]|nr:prepilin-type N-terminal cleavage/methylation domain-containing protein [Zoogloeaceae bacterium]
MESFARALQRGFTFVEVVVVLAIVAILVLFALSVFNTSTAPLEAGHQRRDIIRAHVDTGLAFAGKAKQVFLQEVYNGTARNITVAYPGTGVAPPGSYRGFEFRPTGAVARIAINPVGVVERHSPYRSRVGEGTIWIEMDGEQAPRFGLKLTAGFGGLLANGQPRLPLIIGSDGNLVGIGSHDGPDGNPVGDYTVGDIIWGCSLGDDYSVAKYAQFVPPDCRQGVTP